jgi:hypothetical protein
MALSSVLEQLIRLLEEQDAADEVLRLVTLWDHHNQLEAIVAAARSLTTNWDDCLVLTAQSLIQAVRAGEGAPLDRITVTDLNGQFRDSIQRALAQLNGNRKNGSFSMSHRQYGILGHQAAERIRRKAASPPQLTTPSFWEAEEPLADARGRLNRTYLAPIKKHLRAALAAEKKSANLFVFSKAIDELALSLRPVVGDELIARAGLNRKTFRLYALTIMSWAQYVIATAAEVRPDMITELELVDNEHWIGAGRVDALCPITRDGKPLPKRHRERFNQATLRRPKHLVHLIRMLGRSVGDSIFFRVDDYKFQVGDALGAFEELDAKHIEAGPLAKHLDQMQRYLAMGNVALRRARYLEHTPWDLPLIQEGRLIYIFAHRPPIVHIVRMTPEERLSHYTAYRKQRPELQEAARFRRLTQTMIRSMRTVGANLFSE